jgi:hypothetical protein
MSRASIISALQSIIANANATTGQSDATVTSATDRLIRGYGGGASNIIAETDVTPDGTEYLSFECPEEPDAVIIYINGWSYDDAVDAAIGFAAVKNHFVAGYRVSQSGNYGTMGVLRNQGVAYPWGYATGNGSISGGYTEGAFSARTRGGTSYRWNTSYTYHCIAIKF